MTDSAPQKQLPDSVNKTFVLQEFRTHSLPLPTASHPNPPYCTQPDSYTTCSDFDVTLNFMEDVLAKCAGIPGPIVSTRPYSSNEPHHFADLHHQLHSQQHPSATGYPTLRHKTHVPYRSVVYYTCTVVYRHGDALMRRDTPGQRHSHAQRTPRPKARSQVADQWWARPQHPARGAAASSRPFSSSTRPCESTGS